MASAEKKSARGGKRGERAPTRSFTMRLRPPLFAEIKQAAETAQTSIAAEAERRLEQPAVGELARLIDLAISSVERRSGSTWREDEVTALRVRAAVDALLSMVLGDLPTANAIYAKFESESDRILPDLAARVAKDIEPTPDQREAAAQLTKLGQIAAVVADDRAAIIPLAQRAWR